MVNLTERDATGYHPQSAWHPFGKNRLILMTA